jgi:hypothetical protein
MYRFCGELVCLSKPGKVTDKYLQNTSLLQNLFSVHYKSVMFYNKNPAEKAFQGKQIGFLSVVSVTMKKSFITLKLGDPELEKVSPFWDFFDKEHFFNRKRKNREISPAILAT